MCKLLSVEAVSSLWLEKQVSLISCVLQDIDVLIIKQQSDFSCLSGLSVLDNRVKAHDGDCQELHLTQL